MNQYSNSTTTFPQALRDIIAFQSTGNNFQLNLHLISLFWFTYQKWNCEMWTINYSLKAFFLGSWPHGKPRLTLVHISDVPVLLLCTHTHIRSPIMHSRKVIGSGSRSKSSTSPLSTPGFGLTFQSRLKRWPLKRLRGFYFFPARKPSLRKQLMHKLLCERDECQARMLRDI